MKCFRVPIFCYKLDFLICLEVYGLKVHLKVRGLEKLGWLLW